MKHVQKNYVNLFQYPQSIVHRATMYNIIPHFHNMQIDVLDNDCID